MKMSDNDLTNECKNKALASYGVRHEKIERLLKFHGTKVVICSKVAGMNSSQLNLPSANSKKKNKTNVVQEIEKLKQQREDRRKA
jgi:hypothetical protein